jgi:N-acetylmuramoyl-L-alanine amidase
MTRRVRNGRAAALGVVVLAAVATAALVVPAHAGPRVLAEKDANLDIARRVATRLQADGLGVAMTRTGDQTVSLGARTNLVTARHADLFVSVHNNAGSSTAAHSEVYHQVASSASARLGTLVGNGLRADLPGRDVRVVARSSGAGPDRDYYFVLRNSPVPALIVEGAFVSNPTEARLLATSADFRQRLADGIADGVVAWATSLPSPTAPNVDAGLHAQLPVVATPLGVSAVAANSHNVDVTWAAPVSDPAFRVYRDGRLIGQVANSAYSPGGGPGHPMAFRDAWVGPGQAHVYDVRGAVPSLAGLVLESLSATASVRVPAITVVVDPGHGGRDSGALGRY